jgi:arylsulfatase A-like enzyme
MASLLTGLLPHAHGQVRIDPDARLAEAVTTYPEVLREAYGYETAAFVNGPWFRSGPESVLQGFAHVGKGAFSLQRCETAVASWNRRRDKTRPFFLLLHTFDAHFPYGASNHPWPPATRERRPPPALLRSYADPAELLRVCLLDIEGRLGLGRALGDGLSRTIQRYLYEGYSAQPRPDLASDLRFAYWEGVRWTDGLLRDAYGYFDREGMLDNTVCVVTADHGEAFGEHGNLTHGLVLYDEVIRIPMVWTGPPPFDGGTVFSSGGGLIDVLPTFCDFAGIDPLLPGTGRSLLPHLVDDDTCLPSIAEEKLTFDNTGCDVEIARMSIRTPEWKYILTYDRRRGTVREEAYDLLIDEAEFDDIGGGDGSLPASHRFDDCVCPAIEAARTRLWETSFAPGEGDAAPYDSRTPPKRTPRPEPCTSSAD